MRSLYDELGGQNAVHPVDEELFKATEKKNWTRNISRILSWNFDFDESFEPRVFGQKKPTKPLSLVAL